MGDWTDNWMKSQDPFSSCLLFSTKTYTVKHWMDFQFVELNGNTAQCNLFRVNIFENPDTGFVIYRSTLSPLSPLLDGWAITNLWSQCMLGNQRGTQGTTIYSSTSCVFSSFHNSTRWTPVSRRGGSTVMVRLGLPVFLLLCFSLLRLSCGRPSRTKKAISPSQAGGNAHIIHKCGSCQTFSHLCSPDLCVDASLWGYICRGRRREVPDREAVAGGQLTEGDTGFADRYAQPKTDEKMDKMVY